MLLRKIDYHRILKRAILSVFAIMLLITLPHLLGNFVYYHHGSHTARATECPDREFCNSNLTAMPMQENLKFCNQNDNTRSLTEWEQDVYARFAEELCDMAKQYDDAGERYWVCRGEPMSISASKFSPSLNILYRFTNYGLFPYEAQICRVDVSAMKYDSDFVKAVYLGIDLPLRYVIPCCLLAVINILLVRSVRKAQRRHSEISQTASTSLLNLPVLRSAVGIVFIFLICHTGGVGLFVLNVFRAFSKHNEGFIGTGVNVFIDEGMATMGLEMRYSALLLAAVNSSVNIVLYCFFLPTFRKQWKLLFVPRGEWKIRKKPKEPIPPIIPLEEIELSPRQVSFHMDLCHNV